MADDDVHLRDPRDMTRTRAVPEPPEPAGSADRPAPGRPGRPGRPGHPGGGGGPHGPSGPTGPGGPGRPAGRPDAAARWKALFVAVLVLGSLGLAAWLLLGSKLLVVRHVEVVGAHLVPRDRIAAAARIRLGVPMVRLDVDAIGDRVESARGVETASIQRRWPGTVRIVVHERVPVAVVERDGRFHELDRHGVSVLDVPARPGGFPVLVTPAPGPGDPATRAALDVRAALPSRYATKLLTIEAPTAESVTLRLKTGLTIMWGSAERTDEKVRLVDALLRSPAGRTSRSIDVGSPEVVTTG